MNIQSPEQITEALGRVLLKVRQPARYVGGEWNSVRKDWRAMRSRVALAFPDIYDLGMSNLGLAILYDTLNKREDVLAERVFLPWIDMEAIMREGDIPLFSLETRHPVAQFDILGITIPYEQLYTNVLNLLDLAGVPLRSEDRSPEHPLVLAGGSGMTNPEPMWPFLDAVFLGEGEEAIHEIVDVHTAWREEGRPGGRIELLRRLARTPGLYIPGFYESSYNPDGALTATTPRPEFTDVAPRVVQKRIVPVLPPPVTDFVVPYIDTIHNRAAIEIQRGCTRGCRFCHAGYAFRPVRERPLAEVLTAVDKAIASTGFEEVSFLSLSSSDYAYIAELVDEVTRRYQDKRLSIGLPSLRIESFSVELMEKLAKGRRRSGFTLAPEAATDRLRDVINKPIPTDLMLRTAHQVYSRGWTTIKMYFMIGHPTQTMDDVAAIADLAHRVLAIGREHLGRKAKVRVGVSILVPKPHTAFQWARLEDEDTLEQQLNYLRRRLRVPGIHFTWSKPRESLMEAFLSRGDRRLADVIQRAWELGAKFDAWGDQFDWDAWRQAFREAGLDMDWYARRGRSVDETLPWDHLSMGLDKDFLVREWLLSQEGGVIDDCREHCFSCGILTAFRNERRQAQKELGGDGGWGCPAFGRDATRQPVSRQQVPLFFDPEMSPQKVHLGQFDYPVLQRRKVFEMHEEQAKSAVLSEPETDIVTANVTNLQDSDQ